MGVAFWAFTDFGTLQADIYDTAFFWVKISAFWYFIIPLLLHFNSALHKLRENKSRKGHLGWNVCACNVLLHIRCNNQLVNR